MKKKKQEVETREEHYEKLRFVNDYLKVERKVNKYRKLRKGAKIIFILTYLSLGVIAIFNYSLSLIISTYFSMAFAPTYYVFWSVMKDTVNDCSYMNINYKEFKKMYKSGEIEKLKQELEELRHPKPIQKGVEDLKITNTNNDKTSHQQVEINYQQPQSVNHLER